MGPTQPAVQWVGVIPGVKRPGIDLNHRSPSSPRVHERVEIYFQ